MTATPIDFHAQLADVQFPIAIEYEGADTVVLTEADRDGHVLRALVHKPAATKAEALPNVKLTTSVAELASWVVRAKPMRAFELSGGELSPPSTTTIQRTGCLFDLALLAGAFVLAIVIGFEWLIPLLAAVFTAAWIRSKAFTRYFPSYHLLYAGAPIDAVIKWGPAVSADPPISIDALKAEYGTLLSDIVYRIENPALFDVAVPTTRTFTEALLQWDNTSGAIQGSERSELAARVRVTFEAARRHAETVGIDHVDEASREDVHRAAKALRLAGSTDNEGERAAANKRAIEILNSLALYYLPNPVEVSTMLEGRRLLALPGRHNPDKGSDEEDQ